MILTQVFFFLYHHSDATELEFESNVVDEHVDLDNDHDSDVIPEPEHVDSESERPEHTAGPESDSKRIKKRKIGFSLLFYLSDRNKQSKLRADKRKKARDDLTQRGIADYFKSCDTRNVLDAIDFAEGRTKPITEQTQKKKKKKGFCILL